MRVGQSAESQDIAEPLLNDMKKIPGIELMWLSLLPIAIVLGLLMVLRGVWMGILQVILATSLLATKLAKYFNK